MMMITATDYPLKTENDDSTSFDEEFEVLFNEIYENENLTEEHSSQCSSVVVVHEQNEDKKKRKMGKNPTNRIKTRNPAFIHSLRIFRRDIRRKYAEMFTNTINSHDSSLVARFFNEFSIPNCRFFMKCIPKDHGPHFPEVCIGPGHIIQNMTLMQYIEPDLVFRMKDCQIHVSEEFNGTLIKGRYFIQATRLYHFSGPYEVPTDLSESYILQKKDSEDESSIYLNNFKWTLMKSPLEMQMECEITMKLDHNHKIISMDTEGIHYEERAL